MGYNPLLDFAPKGANMFQTNLLKGQHILITGGGTGLGRSMALRFFLLRSGFIIPTRGG